jgi:uncharacterized protein (TIGR00730 family)
MIKGNMEKMENEALISQKIQELVVLSGGDPATFEGDLITQQIHTSLKLMVEGHNTGQLKLITRSLKEMRYAYRVFNEYKGGPRISIFGSARTPEEHPDYQAAVTFSRHMAQEGWMCITGAANGIMKAGLMGQKPEGMFGLSIRLPFEIPTTSFIDGDPKLMTFRYFFTRKLMFMSHSDAVAAFPGGVGTLDELFEMLTLMQTGKSTIIPVLLMEGEGGQYWKNWNHYMETNLEANGWICSDDKNFYHIAKSVEEGVAHLLQFYRRFHSYRYVKDYLVIRIKSPIEKHKLLELNQKFASLIKEGQIKQMEALEGEGEECPGMLRLVFHHTRNQFGRLRALIDAINAA